jgi:hypothetical protein
MHLSVIKETKITLQLTCQEKHEKDANLYQNKKFEWSMNV